MADKKENKQKKKGRSTQELIGVRTFSKYGIVTNRSELLYYLVSPTNISVLSRANIEIKIRHGNDNRTVEFQTSSVNEMYTVIAVIATNTSDEWYSFTEADTEEKFDTYVSKARQLSLYDLKMPQEYERKLITLSTCYGSEKSGRLLVVTVKNKM